MRRKEIIRKEYVVRCPLETAWEHLARIEDWPRWGRHIKRVEADPSGPLTASTRAVMRFRNGMRATFRVTEYRPGESWNWAGKSRLGPTIHFDHRFHSLPDGRTRVEYVVEAEGRGPLIRWITARAMNRWLDRGIPRLKRQMESAGARDD